MADKLANLGVLLEEKMVLFDVPPHEIAYLLPEDCWGGYSTPDSLILLNCTELAPHLPKKKKNFKLENL